MSASWNRQEWLAVGLGVLLFLCLVIGVMSIRVLFGITDVLFDLAAVIASGAPLPVECLPEAAQR